MRAVVAAAERGGKEGHSWQLGAAGSDALWRELRCADFWLAVRGASMLKLQFDAIAQSEEV